MKDRIVSLHLNDAMIKIHDNGSNSILTIETVNGTTTANTTRSEMLSFLLESVDLLSGVRCG